MLYKTIQYLKFLFTATNQHGVHSPFVYSYVTKCLYGKPDYRQQKIVGILFKSLTYFKAKKMGVISKNKKLKNLVKAQFPEITINSGPFDIIYIDDPNIEIIKEQLNPGHFHNDTMLIINKIHGSKESLGHWNWVKSNDFVTVTIDMYYCGAVFFRKEQAKEHFKIRI